MELTGGRKTSGDIQKRCGKERIPFFNRMHDTDTVLVKLCSRHVLCCGYGKNGILTLGCPMGEDDELEVRIQHPCEGVGKNERFLAMG